jgi:hypothetical protein
MKPTNLALIFLLIFGGATLADDIQKIDPSKILYSTPTIPNELPPMVRFKGNGDAKIFPINEDDWSQVEFLNSSQLPEIQKTMLEYKAFEAENRRDVGWQNVYVRRFEHKPLFSSMRPKNKLLSILGATEGAPPIVHSVNEISGLVKNGFSIVIGTGVTLYGYTDGLKVKALGASLGGNPDNQSLVIAFSKLNHKFGLILVDWRSQFILTGVKESGEIEIWRP